jgi:hypothetical protein
MGRTVEEAVANAVEALAEWTADVGQTPKPRTVAQLRRDPEVRKALAEGDVLVFVPLVRRASAPSRQRRYA